MSLEDAERELRHTIATLEMDHRRHMEPFYQALAKIEAMKIPRIIDPQIHLWNQIRGLYE